MPRTRPGKRAIYIQPQQADAFKRDIEPGREIELEGKGRKDDEDVEAQVAVNGKTRGGSVRLNIGTELQGIRSDGEVAVGADSRVVAVPDAHREPVQVGNVQSVGIEVAEREQEIRVVTPGKPQSEVAGEGKDQDVRIVERAVNRQRLGAKVE